MRSKAFVSSVGRVVAALLLIACVLIIIQAAGVDPDIDYTAPGCGPLTQPQQPDITFAAQPGDNLATVMPPANISVKGGSGNVNWALDGSTFLTNGCKGDANTDNCGIDAMHPNPLFQITAPSGDVSPTTPAGQVLIRNSPSTTIASGDVGRSGTFNVTVAQAGGGPTCTWTYQVHVVAPPSGGWGDPHMTTVDGVQYDFQGAGEFTELKQGNKFEVQARQRPVSTQGVGPVNAHTGLGTCVATYSAVALRIGSNQVSLVPNLSGQPDPTGLQLRVNHKLVTIPEGGIELRAGGDPKGALEGRIVRAAGGAYEFDTADGTQVVATPTFWDSQQIWYMNLNVYQSAANQGIWGLIPAGSWLPALPDGTSVGSMPRPLDQRYQTLYTTFGNAWRVTDATTLFDYASGSNTGSFTVADWPRFNPQSCLIQGQPTATPADPAVAAQACSGVTDPVQKANCTFDVTVTGNTGFAQTYLTTQAFKPHGAGWQPALPGVQGGGTGGGGTGGTGGTGGGGLPWWWWIVLLIILLIILIVWIARRK